VVDASHAQDLLSDSTFHSEWMRASPGIAITARWAKTILLERQSGLLPFRDRCWRAMYAVEKIWPL
jgi:hypothetical protein